MQNSRVASAEIIKIEGPHNVTKPDLLAVEEPLEIRLGFGPTDSRFQESISVTMRTPGHDFELALGFLLTENVIANYYDVVSIKYCENVKSEEKDNVVRVELKPEVEVNMNNLQRHFYTSSSCGVCGKSSIEAVNQKCMPLIPGFPVISAQMIHNAPEELRQAQQVFNHTGGLHAAGLFDAMGEMVMMREDVGRHNALDKLLGAALSKALVPLSNYFVLVSGRTSFELVQKCLVAGVPILAAVGSPSSLAVSMARDNAMTLIGFVRDNKFNIYTGAERLKFEREKNEN